ncbi:MAG: hypothetical protein ABIR91_04960 [Candidatus Saccharimonadales bacterium]
MPSTSSLRNQLIADYPDLQFGTGELNHWSSTEQTVYYNPDTIDDATLLHEVSHGLLQHTDYDKDIVLIDMEREAWAYAVQTLGPKYAVTISDDTVQDSLDSYRDWLHARSTCPNCSSTGVQIQSNEYKCIACQTIWRVNDARICALRRYIEPA